MCLTTTPITQSQTLYCSYHSNSGALSRTFRSETIQKSSVAKQLGTNPGTAPSPNPKRPTSSNLIGMLKKKSKCTTRSCCSTFRFRSPVLDSMRGNKNNRHIQTYTKVSRVVFSNNCYQILAVVECNG